MTKGYLVEAIGFMIQDLSERWPERITRDEDFGLPGVYIEVSPTLTIWVGNHFTWQMWEAPELKTIADALDMARRTLEAA